MAIVTLTTDYGLRDHYAASLKGSVMSSCPTAQIVDVSHEVAPFDIIEASFLLGSCFPMFPKGTIHLIGVDPAGGNQTHSLAMEMDGHFFLSPDNGILSLLSEGKEANFALISPEVIPFPEEGRAFQAANRLSKAIPLILEAGNIFVLGDRITPPPTVFGAPAQTQDAIRGYFIHVDRFGNGITNISKSLFLSAKGDRAFKIYFRNVAISRIVTSYVDVGKGQPFAIFSQNGFLEIGLREESATKLQGINRHDSISIEFTG